MKLLPSEVPWCPENYPDHAIILGLEERPPHDQEAYLLKEVELLKRLVQEASEGEIENANRMLADLPDEDQLGLPLDPMSDPRGPRALLTNPASEGSRLHEWKTDIEEALKDKPMSPEEAKDLVKEMSLESFLSPLR